MERTSTLFGRRVMLRPLVLSDFSAWREVRVRCADWLLKWEPQRLPHQPDTTQDRDAFAVRCSARALSRSRRRKATISKYSRPSSHPFTPQVIST